MYRKLTLLLLPATLFLTGCFMTDDENFYCGGSCPATEIIKVAPGSYTETSAPSKTIHFDRVTGVLTVQYTNEYGELIVETWQRKIPID